MRDLRDRARDHARAISHAEIRPARTAAGWEVASASRPGHLHAVTASDDGYVCTCEGFRGWGHCWHVGAVEDELWRQEHRRPAIAGGAGQLDDRDTLPLAAHGGEGIWMAERPRRATTAPAADESFAEFAARMDRENKRDTGRGGVPTGRQEMRTMATNSNGTAAKVPTIDERYIVERQGRRFVLYAGLLDLAHAIGLKAIRTELLQADSEHAIVKATVELLDGRSFDGIGDADETNLAPAMRTVKIRMAETRAKARALRDATNAAALVALEELGDELRDEPPARPPTPTTLSGTPRGAALGDAVADDVLARAGRGLAATSSRTEGEPLATEKQIAWLLDLAAKNGLTPEDVEATIARSFGGRTLAQLTRREVSGLIDKLRPSA